MRPLPLLLASAATQNQINGRVKGDLFEDLSLKRSLRGLAEMLTIVGFVTEGSVAIASDLGLLVSRLSQNGPEGRSSSTRRPLSFASLIHSRLSALNVSSTKASASLLTPKDRLQHTEVSPLSHESSILVNTP